MSLALCIITTWCAIAVLALIPKRLTTVEMVFLLFICTIFELSVFNMFNLNLQWMTVSKNVEKSFADLAMRLICIPVVLLITSNVILYTSWLVKFFGVVTTVAIGVLMEKMVEGLGILFTPHWNVGYTVLLFCVYILFAGLMTFFITHLRQTEGGIT